MAKDIFNSSRCRMRKDCLICDTPPPPPPPPAVAVNSYGWPRTAACRLPEHAAVSQGFGLTSSAHAAHPPRQGNGPVFRDTSHVSL